jgi:hypothetical protein
MPAKDTLLVDLQGRLDYTTETDGDYRCGSH